MQIMKGMAKWGTEIRNVRLSQGKLLTEVSMDTGISKSDLEEIEANRKVPYPMPVFQSIANSLGVEPHAIMYNAAQAAITPENASCWVDHYPRIKNEIDRIKNSIENNHLIKLHPDMSSDIEAV